jgi:type III pantothenate kinase
MLLAIDVGNTNVVLGLFERSREPRATVRITTRRDATADEVSLVVSHLLAKAGTESAQLSRSVICSVVPTLTHSVTSFVENELGHEPLVISAKSELGVPLAVDDPREVGPDRIVNALAARETIGVPAIVVDLGTATTFDCLDREGRYVGGVIAPGLETSAEELFRRAARLTKIDFTFPDRLLGKNTRDCLRSGTLNGSVGMIDALVAGLWRELDGRGTTVATGGLAPLIGPRCETVDRVDVDLTLKGLVAADDILGPG